MRNLGCAILATCMALASPSASAQQTPWISGQALLGPAVRATSASPSSTQGFQVVARLRFRVHRSVGLVAEASLATFADQLVFAACPPGLPCLAARHFAGGLGVVGMSAGLQPRWHVGPVELQFTGTAGGYWLYHSRAAAPALAPGVRGALGIGLPISNSLHVLLEGSATQLLRSGIDEANTRHVGIGLAIN